MAADMSCTVMVVDDSSFITEGLASILKKHYRTIISSGGEMCLEILKKEIPDVIILDILMEPMDGWETLLRIREDPKTCHIPVIMFSAKRISPFEAESHRPHIDDYITKPVSPRELLDAIDRVLSRKEASRRNLERWRDAGMDAAEIEEYTRCMTCIEVDQGFCSNLRMQLETDRMEVPREDLTKMIAALTARIQKNAQRAGEIATKGDALVAAGSGRAKMAQPEERTDSGSSTPEPAHPDMQPESGVPEYRDTGSAPESPGSQEPDRAAQDEECEGSPAEDSAGNITEIPAASARETPDDPVPCLHQSPLPEVQEKPVMLPGTLEESLFEEEELAADSGTAKAAAPDEPQKGHAPADIRKSPRDPGPDEGILQTTPPAKASNDTAGEITCRPGEERAREPSAGVLTVPGPGSARSRESPPAGNRKDQPGIIARVFSAILRLFSRTGR